MNLSKIPWFLPTVLILVTAGWADDAVPSSTTPPKIVRRQIPEPPARLLHLIAQQQAQQSNVPAQDVPSDVLTWDADSKEQSVPGDTPEAHFTFTVTNISPHDVTIVSAIASCGCTVPKLPEDPKIIPGASARIEVTMNLKNKFSMVAKTVTISTDKGVKVLHVTVHLPPPTLREIRQQMTLTDRQVVFKGECARCHMEPARGKAGQELYASACGICHESPQRATMVPDLHALTHETNAEYWKNIITYGKPGTLMPAFAQSEGGFLTDGQIASLVEYLSTAIPSRAQTGMAK